MRAACAGGARKRKKVGEVEYRCCGVDFETCWKLDMKTSNQNNTPTYNMPVACSNKCPRTAMFAVRKNPIVCMNVKGCMTSTGYSVDFEVNNHSPNIYNASPN